MAFFTDTHHRDTGLFERAAASLSHWLADAADALARRRITRETYSELSALSNRELADLGINRCELRRIALEAAEANV